ncbi:MAG TPA: hypothetical protein VNA86_00855, partial [bacterium]|nr:hypothetical protein [bacterium]
RDNEAAQQRQDGGAYSEAHKLPPKTAIYHYYTTLYDVRGPRPPPVSAAGRIRFPPFGEIRAQPASPRGVVQ